MKTTKECLFAWTAVLSSVLAVALYGGFAFHCESIEALGENGQTYGPWYIKNIVLRGDDTNNKSTNLNTLFRPENSLGQYIGGDEYHSCIRYYFGLDRTIVGVRTLSLFAIGLGAVYVALLVLAHTMCRGRWYSQSVSSSSRWGAMNSVAALVVIVLQGCSFLLLRSESICGEQGCRLGNGGWANVVSIVFWLVTSASAILAGVPRSIDRSSRNQDVTVTYERNAEGVVERTSVVRGVVAPAVEVNQEKV